MKNKPIIIQVEDLVVFNETNNNLNFDDIKVVAILPNGQGILLNKSQVAGAVSPNLQQVLTSGSSADRGIDIAKLNDSSLRIETRRSGMVETGAYLQSNGTLVLYNEFGSVIFAANGINDNRVLQAPNQSGTLLVDAEADGSLYARKDNAWVVIPDGVISVTLAEAITLINAEGLKPGVIYQINGVDVPLYGGTTIFLQAVTTTEFSFAGKGIFYTPKYDVSVEQNGYGIFTLYMSGTFSNIVGEFEINEEVIANNGAVATYLGDGFLNYDNAIATDWSLATSITGQISAATADVAGFTSPNYNIDDVVHWGGFSWTAIDSGVTTPIDKYTLDLAQFVQIPFNATDYNISIDDIHYDFINDMIISRKDRFNNEVTGTQQVFEEFISLDGYGYGNPIRDFQWGCMQDTFNTDDYFYLGLQGNKVINSYFETLNTLCRYMWFNTFRDFSVGTLNICSRKSRVNENTFEKGSQFKENIIDGFIERNQFYTGSLLDNYISNQSGINTNNLISSYMSANILKAAYITGNVLDTSYFSDNILKTNAYLQYNQLYSSYFTANILTGGQIGYNALSGSSYIYENVLIQNSSISTNVLTTSGVINTNNLSGSSNIFKNTVSGSSAIIQNTLSASAAILNNQLNGVSNINLNVLTNAGSFNSNILFGSSALTSNILSGGNFSSNNLNCSTFKFTNILANSVLIQILANGFNRQGTALDILTAPILYNDQVPKTLFNNIAQVQRLSYFDAADALIVGDIDI